MKTTSRSGSLKVEPHRLYRLSRRSQTLVREHNDSHTMLGAPLPSHTAAPKPLVQLLAPIGPNTQEVSVKLQRHAAHILQVTLHNLHAERLHRRLTQHVRLNGFTLVVALVTVGT